VLAPLIGWRPGQPPGWSCLVFTNSHKLGITFVDMGMVKTDIFHPPKVIDTDLMFHKSTYIYEHSSRKYSVGNYSIFPVKLLLVSNSPHNNTTADAALHSINAAVHYALH
jgi:hypothetical protein